MQQKERKEEHCREQITDTRAWKGRAAALPSAQLATGFLGLCPMYSLLCLFASKTSSVLCKYLSVEILVAVSRQDREQVQLGPARFHLQEDMKSASTTPAKSVESAVGMQPSMLPCRRFAPWRQSTNSAGCAFARPLPTCVLS